jgi:tetratricopeptide (TPR) repeat protein
MTHDDEDDGLLRVLRDPLLWAEPPAFRSLDGIDSILEMIDAEDAEAAALCGTLLSGPSARWPERFRTTPGTRTAAMVRQLLERMSALIECRPADALQATSIAMEIADVLQSRHEWPDESIIVRAQALRDHAYVLSFLGRYTDALQYVAEAERTFAQVPGEDVDLARLALVKASALRMQNRSEEAIVLTRQAAATFLEFEDRPRYVNARIAEAAMLYDAGAVQRAMELWGGLKGDPGLDEIGELRIAHNIAVCLCDFGRQAEAVPLLERCVSAFAIAGLSTERTRSRWYLGNALVGTARRSEGMAALRLAWREFTELRLLVDGALAALDLAEALVVYAEPEQDQVPMICHDVIRHLTDAGLAMQAIPALTLLREEAALGRASRDLIRDTHATVKRVGRERVQGDVRATARALSPNGGMKSVLLARHDPEP